MHSSPRGTEELEQGLGKEREMQERGVGLGLSQHYRLMHLLTRGQPRAAPTRGKLHRPCGLRHWSLSKQLFGPWLLNFVIFPMDRDSRSIAAVLAKGAL